MTTDDLQKLLLNLGGMNDVQVEAAGRTAFNALCDESHQKQSLVTHDGIAVFFYRNRFEHAFFTSSDRARHRDLKDKLATDRIERVHWIREFISGNVDGVECWQVERLDGKLAPPIRVYLTWTPPYIVWLDEVDGGFRYRYSTAYPVAPSDLRRYCKKGTKIWPI